MLPNSVLNITVTSPVYYPAAFGHFTIRDDTGGFHRFLKDPVFVNGQVCDKVDFKKPNIFTSTWRFDYPTPPIGTWFDIWISVYWDCEFEVIGGGVYCTSEELHHRDYVK